MDGGFVDTYAEMGVTEQEVNDVVAALNEDDSKWIAWWQDQNMPEGLQCIEVHMHPTTKEFIEKCWAERNYAPEGQDRKTALIACELILDSMIS